MSVGEKGKRMTTIRANGQLILELPTEEAVTLHAPMILGNRIWLMGSTVSSGTFKIPLEGFEPGQKITVTVEYSQAVEPARKPHERVLDPRD